MTGNITIPTTDDVDSFLATLESDEQRRDSQTLLRMMSDVSGKSPVMWGSSIIGFGRFTYRYASGREGDWMRIGFSPRKGMLSLYITDDASQFKKELEAIGRHKVGKGCIYLKRLADIDLEALKVLIEQAYKRGL